MMASNETAERLRDQLSKEYYEQDYTTPHTDLLDEALAAERKVMVERIRAALDRELETPASTQAYEQGYDRCSRDVFAILDAEAAR